ncbi:MAG: hypothetical protein CMF31_06805 [Kordiimonas sp.]|nr:hypothetical protein [Kordiimonas sp.]|tara:strand:- start:1549 stop:1839 length:291 start_codon:yes stop_codon:yes gene_type:complete
MYLFLQVILIISLCFGLLYVLHMLITVRRANKNDYELSRAITGTFQNAFRGEVDTFRDGKRDYRVSAGLIVDRKTNTWKEQGKLSEEALDTILYPK